MAKIILEFFQELPKAERLEIGAYSKDIVAQVHYGTQFGNRKPGEIGLSVPVLEIDECESDAVFELMITEGSENWPKHARAKNIKDLYTADLDFTIEERRGAIIRALEENERMIDLQGALLPVVETSKIMEERAKKISEYLALFRKNISHNIYEYSGNGTGWVQYKPSMFE